MYLSISLPCMSVLHRSPSQQATATNTSSVDARLDIELVAQPLEKCSVCFSL